MEISLGFLLSSLKGFLHETGNLFGVLGYSFFVFSLVLATRWKKLEDWIGGLDQIYHLHRIFGIWGFCLILLHPWIEALRWLPNHLEKFFLFTLPLHGRFAVNLGSIAYWIMIAILGVTLLRLLPYDKWKVLHRFMSLVFLLASSHIFLLEEKFNRESPQPFLLVLFVIGFIAILYKQLLAPLFIKKPELEVKEVRAINENVVEISLIPIEGNSLNFIPGQYGFFSFDGPSLSKESHPFTMVGSPNNPLIRILIKARGDYTKNLYQNIRRGYRAWFEGPYGRFDYKALRKNQVWIAGGIGIVPFLSWIDCMNEAVANHFKIDLYYCIHKKSDAIFYEEFQHFEKKHPHFRCFLHCTEENNRLDCEKILETSGPLDFKSILICGPLKLTREFTKQLLSLGVGRKDIFYEDFEFF